MTIKPNDFVVIDSQWYSSRYDVRQVIKVTAQMYFYKGEGTGRETRARLDEVLFSSSDEGAVRKLAERLKSAFALHEDEKRKSYDRWSARKDDLIKVAARSPQETE